MERKRKYEAIPGLSLEAFLRQADAPDTADGEEAAASFLVFEVNGEPFAIGVEHTEGVVNCPRLTPLPHAPDGVAGVGSVRGRITVAVNLSRERQPRQERRRLILLKGDAQLGLLADRVAGVEALPRKRIFVLAGRASGPSSPGLKTGDTNRPVLGYFKKDGRRVPIIDVDKLADL